MIKLDKIDRAEALRYLSYGVKNADENLLSLFDECEEKLLAVINPKYVYRIFDIEKITENEVFLKGCKMVMRGLDISTHLNGCQKAVLLCATIGAETDKLLRTMQISDMLKAVVTDTMGSAAIEQVCNELENIIHNDYNTMHMTWRFSAGYGDFPLDTQKEFLDVLNANKICGVGLLDSLLMTPTKSVTAVIGLSENEITRKKRGCAVCNLKDSCAFRKRGMHCE